MTFWVICLLLLATLASVSAYETVPGVVIAHLPQSSGRYLGSPGLAILPNGEYVASHDDFGPKSDAKKTYLFASPDRGKTWKARATIDGQYWSSLFVHRGALYVFGTSREYGDIVIRRSNDGGRTWTTPTDAAHGRLTTDSQYHCAPVPILAHDGRLWRAFERRDPARGWAENFEAFVVSAPDSSNLLDAANWRFSERLRCQSVWNLHGWLEGNVVETPSGEVADILRTDSRDTEKAAFVMADAEGKTLRFDPKMGIRPFPGGCKKFAVRFDRVSHLYWVLANDSPGRPPDAVPGTVRNTLVLSASPDLKTWTTRAVVLHHPDTARHGFQYADWQFDGEDLIFVSRTAFDDETGGAHDAHDANFLTFHRISRFRALLENPK